MSNTFKMPKPVGYMSTSKYISFPHFGEIPLGGFNSSYINTPIYTSEQVKEILEQYAKEIERMGGFKDGYTCGSMLREIKEMVK